MAGSYTVFVTSCKGGVGKSTVAVNLAAAMLQYGKRVLLIDWDIKNRCLDLLVGCEDTAVYDLYDAAREKVELKRVLLTPFAENPEFLFVPGASGGGDEVPPEKIRDTILTLKEISGADVVVIDTQGGISPELEVCAGLADAALVVTTQHSTAIRGAEKAGNYLWNAGCRDVRLVINSFDFSRAAGGDRPGILEMIDRCRLRTAGVVPFDYNIELLQDKGIPAVKIPVLAGDKKISRRSLVKPGDVHCAGGRAFCNIASRLLREDVPLFHGMREFSGRQKYL